MTDPTTTIARAIQENGLSIADYLEGGTWDGVYEHTAQAAIAAYHKHLAEAGLVIVPAEPTEAMLERGVIGLSSNGVDEANKDDALLCYEAMIAGAGDE